MGKQAIVLNKANGRIAYRFHARDLHLVMGPAARGTSVRFRVLIDGQPPGAAHGVDVDDQGNGTVTEQRLYQLIRQPKPIADRQFEIEFLDSGVEAFSFTFGLHDPQGILVPLGSSRFHRRVRQKLVEAFAVIIFSSANYHANAAGIADIRERVRIQQDHVGQITGLDCS